MKDKLIQFHLRGYSRMDLSDIPSLKLRERAFTEKLTPKMHASKSRDLTFHSLNAEKVLKFLCQYENGLFRPDKCNAYEPAREIFNCDDLSRPVRWLSQVGGSFSCRRRKTIKYEGDISNKRWQVFWETNHGLTIIRPMPRDRKILTEVMFWLATYPSDNNTINSMKHFFINFMKVLEVDFGFFTPEDDYEKKNHLVTRDAISTSSRFIGDDPEKCLPGMYWVNYFGKLYVDWFTEQKFLTLPAGTKTKLTNGAYVVQCGEKPPLPGETENQVIEQQAIEHLGSGAFFDIRRLDRKCVTPIFPDPPETQ